MNLTVKQSDVPAGVDLDPEEITIDVEHAQAAADFFNYLALKLSQLAPKSNTVYPERIGG